MSWPLASFLVVGIVLGIGWLAYECRRPSARTAAVVAVMAALAALGRDAFAALPDVKPITAMTLVVGYTLGPLPGFTVGALGMLVSNFLLGQGPYTPWQMAAWGFVGLAGAAIGALSRRRLGRLPLALACAATALAAKEVMNLYTWTIGTSHTPAAFLAVAGQALAYDLTDVIASFLFGLAFAPELARVLSRMRLRMNVAWEQAPTAAAPGATVGAAAPGGVGAAGRGGRAWVGPAGTITVLAVAAAALLGCSGAVGAADRAGGPAAGAATSGASGASDPAAGATAPPGAGTIAATSRVDIASEVAFLARAQNPDGGFGSAPGAPSSELFSAWAAIGLAAAGRDPLSLRRHGHTVLEALRREAASLSGAGDLERTILALAACGASVHALPGGDPVARLLRLQSSGGSFEHLVNLTAFAIFALRAAGYPTTDAHVASATRWLVRQQGRSGGFGYAAGGALPDVDDTAAALQALLAGGVHRPAAIHAAVGFLVRSQNIDGGYPQQSGGSSNAQSTAWAVQALYAAGRDPSRVSTRGSRSPVSYLQSLVGSDGSVRYSRTGAQTPVWVTAQALTALAGRPFPIAPAAGLHAHSAPV
jgi:prenyltransferase beta subunit